MKQLVALLLIFLPAALPAQAPSGSTDNGASGNGTFLLLLLIAAVAVCIVAARRQEKRKAGLATVSPEEHAKAALAAAHGAINPMMVCPHCQTRGEVRTKPVVRKKGVSGGKAAAAVMTAGISTLAVGLSRKESLTEAWCGACSNTWVF